MNRIILSLALVITLFISCGAPLYYEKAEINEGFSFGGGAGIGNGYVPGVWESDGSYYIAGLETAFLRYGFSDKISMFFQATYGQIALMYEAAQWSDVPMQNGIMDIQAGVKLRIQERGALRLCVGLPSIFDVTFLYDLRDWLTLDGGLQLRGDLTPSLGVTFHPRISQYLYSHISFNLATSILGLIYPDIYQSYSHTYPPPIFTSFGIGLEGIPNIFSRNISISMLQFTAGAIGLCAPLIIQHWIIIPLMPISGIASIYHIGNLFYDKDSRGSLKWTIAGALAGALLTGVTDILIKNEKWLAYTIPVGFSLGGTLGYQLSRPKEDDSNSMNIYFGFPNISIKPIMTKDGKQMIAFDAQLVNIRF